MAYKDQEPNFDKAKNIHVTVKSDELNDFKQLTTAATLLGVCEKTLARITGSVLVIPDKSPTPGRKINIGLQLKSRNPVR